jgi:hypothetical protein
MSYSPYLDNSWLTLFWYHRASGRMSHCCSRITHPNRVSAASTSAGGGCCSTPTKPAGTASECILQAPCRLCAAFQGLQRRCPTPKRWAGCRLWPEAGAASAAESRQSSGQPHTALISVRLPQFPSAHTSLPSAPHTIASPRALWGALVLMLEESNFCPLFSYRYRKFPEQGPIKSGCRK